MSFGSDSHLGSTMETALVEPSNDEGIGGFSTSSLFKSNAEISAIIYSHVLFPKNCNIIPMVLTGLVKFNPMTLKRHELHFMYVIVRLSCVIDS